MYEFRCPHCAIPLRVRDESFRNRTISCPECKREVLIRESDQGLVGVKPEPGPIPVLVEPVTNLRRSHPLPARWIALGTALLCGLGFVLFLVAGRERVPPEPAAVTPPAPVGRPPAEPAVAAPAEALPAPVPDAPAPVDDVTARLQVVFQMLQPGVEERGEYPRFEVGQGGADRSWIARLAETRLPPRQVHWEAGWNAPVNDEFVRRRFPEFENPQVPLKSGDDHYPATHFVGIAGIGNDTAQLAKTHPRAGIFSGSQPTRPADVTDGLSHTVLVAGVESQLGSWASPGRATVRSFTREPYLHGPDGFGTGEADRMTVLMADGSVRDINGKTDPRVVRRMAAMADGLPLDPQHEGDPLLLAAPGGPAMTPALAATDMPILPEFAPDQPVFNIAPRLEQKIASFEQLRPVPLGEVLFDLQELIGVPLDVSQLSEDLRAQPVELKLQNVTVGEILQQVCAAAGMSYKVTPPGIRFDKARAN